MNQSNPENQLTSGTISTEQNTKRHFEYDNGITYHIVVIPDTNQAFVLNCTTRSDLISKLKELRTGELSIAQLFVFEGRRLLLTNPPGQFLIVSEDTAVPLFDYPEPQLSNYIGSFEQTDMPAK